jgi:cell shape-determining protein MreD
MRRIAVLFLTLLLLWLLLAQVNHLLSPWRVYLFAGSLFVTYAALVQPWRAGLASSLLAGVVCDATTPVAFGTHVLLFAAAHAVVFHVRDRVPRNDTVGRVVVTLFANLGLFLALSFTQIHHSPAPAVIWPRLLLDLGCSQVFLAVVAPWFFALQARSLVLAGVERRSLA